MILGKWVNFFEFLFFIGIMVWIVVLFFEFLRGFIEIMYVSC